MKEICPTLFQKRNICDFQCEICELSKHHRTQFLAKPYEKSQPFSLVHSDIWGPSRVVNVSRAKWFITFIDDHTCVC